ncbi:HIT domain-containing protein [Elusimicrobiota bacterium]
MSKDKGEKEILWAPWRVKYITRCDDMECIFCEKPELSKDSENYILHRGEKAFALLNIYPYNNGHLMIAPYKHTGDISELSAEEWAEMMELVSIFTEKIKKEMQAQGFNIGMNVGRIAGAGFCDHLHMHVVPRWGGDTNFMPVIGDQKVISESLDSVYNKLKLNNK